MKSTHSLSITDAGVISKIYLIRGVRVMMDRDLTGMYGVPTKVLNQAVKRNLKRFPSDFMFQLTKEELQNWKSQIVTSNSERLGLRKLPYAFTEQGVAMLSSVLGSDTAIEVNIQIIRIFARMRQVIHEQKDIIIKLEMLEKNMLEHRTKLLQNEKDIELVFQAFERITESTSTPATENWF